MCSQPESRRTSAMTRNAWAIQARRKFRTRIMHRAANGGKTPPHRKERPANGKNGSSGLHAIASTPKPAPKPQFWQCQKMWCGYAYNAESRETCLNCHAPRKPAALAARPIGNWNCPFCNAFCYEREDACYRCHQPRAGSLQPSRRTPSAG